MTAPSVQSLQQMLDVISEQVTSLATAQDLQNERLWIAEQQQQDLQRATDTCTQDLESKIAAGEDVVKALQLEIEQAKATMSTLSTSTGTKREMRLIDDKTKIPTVFAGNRKQWRSWQRSVKAYLNS